MAFCTFNSKSEFIAFQKKLNYASYFRKPLHVIRFKLSEPIVSCSFSFPAAPDDFVFFLNGFEFKCWSGAVLSTCHALSNFTGKRYEIDAVTSNFYPIVDYLHGKSIVISLSNCIDIHNLATVLQITPLVQATCDFVYSAKRSDLIPLAVRAWETRDSILHQILDSMVSHTLDDVDDFDNLSNLLNKSIEALPIQVIEPLAAIPYVRQFSDDMLFSLYSTISDSSKRTVLMKSLRINLLSEQNRQELLTLYDPNEFRSQLVSIGYKHFASNIDHTEAKE